MYYTYMLRCEDNSIYTGITTDIKRRLAEHRARGAKSAKYTLNHPALKIEAAWQSESRSAASKLEFHIKRLTKMQKEELIKTKRLDSLLGEKIEAENYKFTAT